MVTVPQKIKWIAQRHILILEKVLDKSDEKKKKKKDLASQTVILGGNRLQNRRM